MNIPLAASYAGLTIAVYELLANLTNEIEYIWRRHPRFTFVKSLYLFARYFALGAHITNAIGATILHAMYTDLSPSTCRYLLIYKTVVSHSMFGVLNVILIIRMYALYNRSYWMGVLLGVLSAGWITMAVLAAIRGIPPQQFNYTCLTIDRPAAFNLFLIGELSMQGAILILTLSKRVTVRLEGCTTVPPILSLLSRDGSLTFVGVAAFIIAAYALSARPFLLAHTLFPALITVLSSAGCRMILNLQRFPIPDDDSSVGELTSLLDLTWDVQTNLVIP